MQGLLPEKYFKHFPILVVGIQILLQKSILVEELHHSHILLIKFSVYFQDYFGKEQMTYNVHLLQHTVKCVMDLSPLGAHDAFSFENENRFY